MFVIRLFFILGLIPLLAMSVISFEKAEISPVWFWINFIVYLTTICVLCYKVGKEDDE